MKGAEWRYFASFREVVRAVSTTLDIREVLELLVDEVIRVMGLKGCVIRLLNPQQRTLELVAARGLSDAYLHKGSVDADRSISDALTGKIVCIEDVRRDPRAQYQEEAAREGIGSIVSVPMAVKGRIIGVLRLYTAQPRIFSKDELGFAEALGEIGAMAIENARLYEKLRKDYEVVMSDVYAFVGYRRSL